MMSDWNKYKFKELCSIVRGGSPRPINSYLSESGIPWVKISDATSGSAKYISSTKQFIKIEGQSKSRKVYPGDLILSNSATPGLPRFMNIEACIHDGWLLLRNFVNLDKEFAYWLLLCERKSLVQKGNGSVFTNLKTDILKEHEVTIPSLDEQVKIASFLNTIQEKIETNTVMNATLEKIAQRIFKSWFVDFDPVKANAEGVPFDGLSPEIQSLFPNEFEESELGMIPKGWEESTIEKEVKTVGGATPSTKNAEFWDGGEILWTTPKDLSGLKDKVIFNTARKITSSGLKKISSGLLPKNTVLMSSRAPVGYLAIAKEPIAINQGYIAMKCDQEVSPYYMLCWLDKNMDIIKQRAGGTTFSEISKTNFRPIEFLKPSVDAINKFEEVVTPLYEKIEANARMTNNLSKIRDKLLPRLISGKVTIQKAEELLEAAS